MTRLAQLHWSKWDTKDDRPKRARAILEGRSIPDDFAV